MKIIIAVDSFKGSLSSSEIAKILEKGIVSGAILEEKNGERIEIKKILIADGGEGTVETLVRMTNGKLIQTISKGPLMENINTQYGVLGDDKTVVIDMASTCAINMVTEKQKNPMNTTTFGMGEQVLDAINRGYRRFIVGLGGACTNDGGIGMFQSLGFKFIDNNGRILKSGEGGKQLLQVEKIDSSLIDERLKECQFIIASDVKNPLYGKNGAAYVYAPQKGATPEIVEQLDQGLRNYSRVINETFGVDISELPGAGAAGGIGGGLIAFLNGKMKSGIEIIMSYSNFEKEIEDIDLVITGEGKIDMQTLNGKAPYIIAQKAKERGISVIAVCGKNDLTKDISSQMGIDQIYEVSDNRLPLDLNMTIVRHNLKNTALQIGRQIRRLSKTRVEI